MTVCGFVNNNDNVDKKKKTVSLCVTGTQIIMTVVHMYDNLLFVMDRQTFLYTTQVKILQITAIIK